MLKKITAIFVSIIMIGVLSGCSNAGTQDTSKTNSGLNSEVNKPVNSPMPSENDTNPEDFAEMPDENATEDDGTLHVGDVVSLEKILNYISSGGEYAKVYAVKRGDEFVIGYCYDGKRGDWSSKQYEEGALVLIPDTTIVEISATEEEELVYFGSGSAWLNGISEYHYAAPFPVSANTSYGDEIPGEYRASYAFGDAKFYMMNKIEGPRDLEVLSHWTITEVDGIPAEDASIQENLIAIGGYNHVYALLSDKDTIKLGGYENTTFGEAELKCGYMLRRGEEFRLEGTRTKEGYTIIATGKELKELGNYTTYQYFLYGLVQVVD